MNWSDIRYFGPHEFTCRGITCCGGSERMDEDFVVRLDDLRHEFGKPLIVTSGYRCPAHNAAVSSTGSTGPHTKGQAADLSVYGHDAYRLLSLALEHGFTGVGLNQRGSRGHRYMHLDILPDAPGQPRAWIWTY